MLLRASCPFCGRKNKPDAVQCTHCNKSIRLNNEDDRWSEHGLGHLLNPSDPESDDREWIAQTWENIIRHALGIPTQQVTFAKSPAVGRITISSPAVMQPLTQFNKDKRYCDQIKPFNFLLTCHVRAFGQPPESDSEHFHLIAPYQTDPKQWLKMEWIDQYSGKHYRITPTGQHGSRNTARVKTYGDVLLEYEFHPESKCADSNGKPCGKQTVGLLQRRHSWVGQIKYIGKESNSLEEVESGMIHSEQSVYTEYPDPRRDEWETKVLPALRKIPISILERSGLSRRAIMYTLAGKRRPRRKNQELLAAIVRKLGVI